MERLPFGAPNGVRALLFVVTNGCLLWGCLRFSRWAPVLGRHPALALSLVPGWLCVSYTTNTQIEAYIVVILVSFLLSVSHESGADLLRALHRLSEKGRRVDSMVILASGLLLAFSGTRPSDICPTILANSPRVAAFIAGTLLTLGMVLLVQQVPKSRVTATYAAIAIALLSLILRHYSVSWVGRMAIVVTGAGAVIALLDGHRRLAVVLGVASYAWVSRDFEWIAFIPSLLLAECVSRAWASAVDSELLVKQSRQFASMLALVTFLFALGTLQRIGLQGGLQLITIDYTAGTFGDNIIPTYAVALCAGYKFLIAQVLLLAVGLSRMPTEQQKQVLLGVGAAHLARGVALLLMLFTCGQSYWTALRVVADLPFGILGVLAASLAYAFSFEARTCEPA